MKGVLSVILSGKFEQNNEFSQIQNGHEPQHFSIFVEKIKKARPSH